MFFFLNPIQKSGGTNPNFAMQPIHWNATWNLADLAPICKHQLFVASSCHLTARNRSCSTARQQQKPVEQFKSYRKKSCISFRFKDMVSLYHCKTSRFGRSFHRCAGLVGRHGGCWRLPRWKPSAGSPEVSN